MLHRYLLVSPELTMTLNWNHLAPVERAERFTGGWDGTWFEEDYCEGPGQALIVTPKGEVKPCCGFASDLDQLTIGNIYRDNVPTDHPPGAAASVRRQGVPRGPDRDPRRDPGPRPGRAAGGDVESLLLLLVRADARPGGRRHRRRRPDRRLDRATAERAGELLQLGMASRRSAAGR